MCLGYGPREPKPSSLKQPCTNVASRETKNGTSSGALQLRENSHPQAESEFLFVSVVIRSISP